jgi:hypothetical protein
MKLHAEVLLRNASAANSPMEGLDETLTLHRLGVFQGYRLSRALRLRTGGTRATTNVLFC